MDEDEDEPIIRPLGADFAEDVVWTEDILPLLKDLPPNVLNICAYGCSEILNNANEHSGAPVVCVSVSRQGDTVAITVLDEGVGIFRKIQEHWGLDDQRHAVFELTKGKLTTDATRHTGEGIFFTSRMFDHFGILSGELYLSHSSRDWLLDRQGRRPGTMVVMEINRNSTRTTKDVFDHFAAPGDDFGFHKTTVAVRLADEGDTLISRSQGRRIVARLEKFKQVLLDFEGISSITPAFADEVFRVFQGEHPDIRLDVINAIEDVQRMIAKAQTQAAAERP